MPNATGGTITTIGDYKIHTFTTSGTFNVASGGTMEVLVVAGGGGGGGLGSYYCGGGGAGGLIYLNNSNITNGIYNVTVGAGGSANTNGQNSIFNTLTAIGGGAGESGYNGGKSGGSGGGASYTTPGIGTTAQGYGGGTVHGGGGGGASSAGATGNGSSGGGQFGGVGGTGKSFNISGATKWYAGGGAGGAYMAVRTGGLGGGGNGGSWNGPTLSGTSAASNTGGGGGGGSTTSGGSGGSGIVIIKYLAASSPFINIDTHTSLTNNSVTLNATINANSSSSTVELHYGLDINYGMVIVPDNTPISGSTNTPIAVNLIGLDINTTYHYKIISTNANGTSSSNDYTFTTLANLPTATTIIATNVNGQTTTVNGLINAQNASTTINFEYGIDTNYGSTVVAIQSPLNNNIDTAVSANLTDLQPNTIYHYRVKATNSGGTTYGDDGTFMTSSILATATNATPSLITSTTAILQGIVNAKNSVTTVQFQYGTTTDYGNLAAYSIVSGISPTNVSATINDLLPYTTYNYRISVTNSAGTAYSTNGTFITASSKPSVHLEEPTNIEPNSVTVNGIVNPNGLTTSVTFQYGLTNSYGKSIVASPSSLSASNVSSNVSRPLTNLLPYTIYHYRLMTTNSLGTTYSEDGVFTTKGKPPIATSTSVTNITENTATINGTIIANNQTTTVTFGYGLTTHYTESIDGTPLQVDNMTAVSCTGNMVDLRPNTTYHCAINANNQTGYGSGEDLVFTTLALKPSITIQPSTNITAFKATLNSIIDTHSADTTIVIKYGLTTAYGNTINHNNLNSAEEQEINIPLTGLIQNTTYHYQILATNSGGTTTSEDAVFTTTGVKPITNILNASNITLNSATLNGKVNANGDETTVTFEYGLDINYGYTNSSDQNPINGIVDTNVSLNIESLQPNTIYNYRIIASNNEGATTSENMTFTTNIIPSVEVDNVTDITSSTATLKGIVNGNGCETTVFFKYGKTTDYDSQIVLQELINGSENINVSALVENLIPNTLYHYQVVATNIVGTKYSTDGTFTTGHSAPKCITSGVDIIDDTIGVLRGIVDSYGQSTTIIFNYGKTTDYGQSITATQSPITIAGDTEISATITGLQPNTFYHYQIIATNNTGTTTSLNERFFVVGASCLTSPAQGGTITYYNGYTIHTFTSSGIFKVINGGRINALVIAGGGAGGSGFEGAGGGAGGAIYQEKLPISKGEYTVIIGNGGSPNGGQRSGGGSYTSYAGGSGSNSSFSGLTAIGGGGGATGNYYGPMNGYAGGSGGGGAYGDAGGISYGGAGTAGQGHAGSGGRAGGGGGAGAAATSMNGGIGILSSITGTSTYYAGGGGGGEWGTQYGNGGLGGGGKGISLHDGRKLSVTATAGMPNTGGGGGGYGDGWTCKPGAAGGSGVVIIAYKAPYDAPSINEVITTEITMRGAKIKGIINPNNYLTTAILHYGLTSQYDNEITIQEPLNGEEEIETTLNLTDLQPETTYYYQIELIYNNGTIVSDEKTFTTPLLSVLQPIFIE